MPGPAMAGDCREDLIRTPYKNLENPHWWKAQNREGVVFYGWGSHRYTPIARAIRLAGLKLVCNMDTSGSFGVLTGAAEYWSSSWRISQTLGITAPSLIWFVSRWLSSLTWSLVKHERGRALHLRQADLIGAVSPLAVERIRKACLWYGGDALASRVRLIPHPVAMHMRYAGQLKQPRIVTIGRWFPEDWRQKDPFLLMEILSVLLKKCPDLECVVLGRMPEDLRRRFLDKVGAAASRLSLLGARPNPQLVEILQGAQVSLCSSSHESFHIASGEALCCGCSVVAPNLPELPSLQWMTAHGSGALAPRKAGMLAAVVLDELELWKTGGRDAKKISKFWSNLLHADRVAAGILHALEARASTPGQRSQKIDPKGGD